MAAAKKLKIADEKQVERFLTLELVRVTEQAAIAAARLRGRGDERAADQAAVEAMREELNLLPVRATVVIGEGDETEAPLLYVGDEVGTGKGPMLDIAVDSLEATTVCAKNLPNSMSLLALAQPGCLLRTPNIYMEKIAVGPGYPPGLVDLDAPATDMIAAVARAKGVPVHEVTACILDRPRHARLIAEVRATGAAIRLIGDGDIAGVIHATNPEETGIDIYLGSGGAPEGVLAAAALRCTGGQMLGRLMFSGDDQVRKAKAMGIDDLRRVYTLEDMAKGDVLFAATGVTDGNFLTGVRFRPDSIHTHSIVMRSASGTVRSVKAVHRNDAQHGGQ
ncbi:class II fructose-bisphosphatase [Methylobrevis albus]|uniref:Fructose-1,6-bisphosphatase n=1 Tax=Methylobrevis albus TaxID=2793297 RepID=A0A931I4F5_9HYPH|nr:class II fructose-bisphosphatase [Methylobrevis albus]MBH0239712.1 class II fructose-bisphosphatase [Methylobrevis albus]